MKPMTPRQVTDRILLERGIDSPSTAEKITMKRRMEAARKIEDFKSGIFDS